MSASQQRRRAVAEVLLLTSKTFPTEQYQELLNFVKSLQLPPDTTSLVTTVRNEEVAQRKALLSAQKGSEVNEVLQRYGSQWALLSECMGELGLPNDGSPNPIHRGASPGPGQRRRSDSGGAGPSGEPPALRNDRSGSPPHFGGAGAVGAAERPPAFEPQPLSREPRTDGVTRTAAGGFALSVDALAVPCFICSAGGELLEWNAAIAALTGLAAADVVGKKLVEVAVAEEHRGAMERLLSSGDEQEVLLRLQAAGGGEVEVAVTLSSFGEKGASGDGASGVLGVGVDITKLSHSASAALQEAHELKRLIDCANAPIFGINATALITEWNKKATQLTGRSKWEVVGRRLEEFIQSEDRARVVEVLQNALKGKETANFEFPLYSKKGERVEILLNAATRRDAHGQISGVVGVGQDITELNKGKAELARVANDLKMLIESANGARQLGAIRRNSAQFSDATRASLDSSA